jgi:CDP-diacylglycerol--glycerol-3-phosphate 3-phosphatidyltransferase
VNLPNVITMVRLGITCLCLLCLELITDPTAPDRTLAWLAFALFVTAAATDFLDGWLARSLGQVTAFGRVADPFVDKVLVCGTLIAMLRFPSAAAYLPTWVVVAIVAREFLVTSIRGLVEGTGRAFPAERLGKWKMVVQSVTAAALLSIVAGSSFWVLVASAGVWVTLVLTLWSAVAYSVRAARLLGPA